MRALDAFCNIGGAGTGLARAGFEVTGVDIIPQPRYPFEFVQGDAIEYIREHGHEYDFISAGPPCQFDCMLTIGTHKSKPNNHPDLLEPTRDALESTGVPYVIEQPPGRASKRMRVDLTLCGEMFGLGVLRHRNFELGHWTMDKPIHKPHRGRVAGWNHGQWHDGPYVAVYGQGGGKGSLAQWKDAMGIHWTDKRKELAEAIPPAYMEFIAKGWMRSNAQHVPTHQTGR